MCTGLATNNKEYSAAMLKRVALHIVSASACVLPIALAASLHGQVPGQGRNGPGGGGPETRLNLGALGDINNSTPKVTPQRVLQGVVRDKNGDPVKGAMVYLKDDKSSNVRSMLADDKGTFRFVQLSRSAEYKVWAQAQEKKTPAKTVSSFETKDEITRNLQLE